MTENKPSNDMQEEEKGEIEQATSFAEMLDDYEPTPLQRGQYVEGQILEIGDNVILADVEGKRTAVVPPQDLLQIDEADLAQISEGDEVLLYVIRTPVGGEELLVSLQKGLQYQDWVNAKEYMSKDELIELEVIGHNKGGLLVQFGNLRGFIPKSHVPELQHIRSQRELTSQKAKLVGQKLPLKVIEVDRQRKRLVLSAKAAMDEVRQQRLQELKEMEGVVISGVVKNIVDFGAFVDLGGIDGLIHISEIAWQQVNDPGQFLTPGEEVEVLLQSVDIERERVGLSRKAVLPNPWQQFAETHDVGELVEGIVTNVTDFGAFVLVTEQIEGLVHASEMHGTRDSAPQDVLQTGDTVLVRIINIEPEAERLGLSQRRVSRNEEMEWIWQQERAQLQTLDEEE